MGNLLTVQEVLTKFGIARATLYRLVDEGLPYEVVGTRKKLFDPDEVVEFIGKRKNALQSTLAVGEAYTNEELCNLFKCSTQGGMRRSHSTGALVLIAHHDDPHNAYLDYWQDNIFYYTGMGMEGDQDLNFAQNKTLANSNQNGIILYLFEVFSSRKYLYRGIVKLAGQPFVKQECDFAGNPRMVWKFPLQLVGQTLLTEGFVKKEQAALSKSTNALTDQELYRRAYMSDGIPRSRATRTTTYEYNLFVREYANRRANGICQLCRNEAPFQVNGIPFLKSYHLTPLTKGGSDRPENVAALCPNCYERMIQLRLPEDLEAVQKYVLADEDAFRKKLS